MLPKSCAKFILHVAIGVGAEKQGANEGWGVTYLVLYSYGQTKNGFVSLYMEPWTKSRCLNLSKVKYPQTLPTHKLSERNNLRNHYQTQIQGDDMRTIGLFNSGDMRGCPVLEMATGRSNAEEGCQSGSASGYFLSSPRYSLLKKMGAEFIGTFMLIFAATATSIINQKSEGAETLLGLAASTGLAVMVVILATGHISGAHLNPAVTIAFAALNRFPWRHVALYITAQVTASLCAAFVLEGIFHPTMGGDVTVPSTDSYCRAFALELIISFNLMFVVTAMATDTRAVGELAAIAVGATVMLNILIAGPMTGGSMNPVRTLGPAVVAGNYKAIWVYLTAPFLGALLGAATYAAVRLPEEDDGDEHGRRRP